MGGASGPLYGTVFLKMASVCKGKSVLTHEEWVTAFSEARQGLKMRGKAEPGDKTLVDALLPFRDTLLEQVTAGTPLPVAEKHVIAAG